MLNHLGIVQLDAFNAPTESLERSIAAARRRLGGVSLLEWMARRVTDAELLDGTVVLLPGTAAGSCAELAALVPPDVPVVFSPAPAALGRIRDVLATYPSRGAVVVSVSSRLVDPEHIDQLISASRENPACDFISFQASDCPPAAFPQWCRATALEQLEAISTKAGAKSAPANVQLAHFQQRWIPLAARAQQIPSESAEWEADGWEYTQTIFDRLGHEGFDHQWIADRSPSSVLDD